MQIHIYQQQNEYQKINNATQHQGMKQQSCMQFINYIFRQEFIIINSCFR